MTATGSFLVAVAAALFAAVRWDTLGDATKLGILAALTGATLLAGERMRASLPATGRVLTHLGACLAPLNVAAVCVHVMRQQDQPVEISTMAATATLATALTAAALWWLLDRRQSSPLLAGSSAIAVVAASGAFGELAPVPGQVPLVLAALAATLLGARRASVLWATVAGTAPTLVAMASAGRLEGLVVDLPHGLITAAVGFTAAAIIGFEARRTGRPELLVAAATSVVSAMVGAQADLVGWAALLLVIETCALWARRDDFWRTPANVVATVAEGFAIAGFALAAMGLALVQLIDSDSVEPFGTIGLQVTAFLVASWLVADLRRPGGRWIGTAPLVATTVLAGVGLGTHDSVATAVCLAAVGFWAIVADRDLGGPTAAISVCIASMLPGGDLPLAAAFLGVGGSALLGWDARRHPDDWVRACGAPLPLLGALAVLGSEAPTSTSVPVAILLLGLLGEVVGGVRANASRAVGVLVALVVAGDVPWGDGSTLLAAGAAAGLVAVLGAMRDDDPRVLWLLTAAIPVAVGGATVLAGYDPEMTGVALAAVVIVATGIRMVVPARWGDGLFPALVGWSAIAVVAGAEDPRALGATLIVLGCAAIAEALVESSMPYTIVGGVMLWQGTWVLLSDLDVTALDAWTAPVAGALVAAGALIRREQGTSSWIAYAPGLALLGGSALVERFVGGPGVHALVAGGVGVAAVAAGGARRLGGPLLVGTGLLVSLAVFESLTLTAAVPTWAWLAFGGAVLIGIGVWLERRDTGPFEAGQHLVDSMRGRYS